MLGFPLVLLGYPGPGLLRKLFDTLRRFRISIVGRVLDSDVKTRGHASRRPSQLPLLPDWLRVQSSFVK